MKVEEPVESTIAESGGGGGPPVLRRWESTQAGAMTSLRPPWRSRTKPRAVTPSQTRSVVAEAATAESAAAEDQATAKEEATRRALPRTRRRRSMIPRHRLSLGGSRAGEREAVIAAPSTEADLQINASPQRGLSDVTNTESRPSSGKRRKTNSRAAAILAQCKVKISRERRSSSRRSSTTTRRLRSSTSSIAPLGMAFDGMNAADLLASVTKEN